MSVFSRALNDLPVSKREQQRLGACSRDDHFLALLPVWFALLMIAHTIHAITGKWIFNDDGPSAPPPPP